MILSKEVGRIGLKGRGTELGSREKREDRILFLQQERDRTRKNELVLGLTHL